VRQNSAVHGDPDRVYRDLYRAHQPVLDAFARRRVDDPVVVEDLCQKTWVALLKWERSLNGPVDNPVGALISLLKLQLKGYFGRRDKSEFPYSRDLLVRHEDDLIVQRLAAPEVQDLRMDLGAALAELRPDLREVLVLTVVDRLTSAEVALVLNLSESRIDQLRAQGRKALRCSPHLTGYTGLDLQGGGA
jgi:RNA polymerase sigma factor (sigma-70 family)